MHARLALITLVLSLAAPCTFAADTFPPPKDLPAIKEMPDPLTFRSGTKVVTPEQWRRRREEMKAILEEYEYGHMPPGTRKRQGT